MECGHGTERERLLFYRPDVWPLFSHLRTESRARPDGRNSSNQPLLRNSLVHHHIIHCITNHWPVERGSCQKRKRVLCDVICIKHVRCYCRAEEYKGYEDQ